MAESGDTISFLIMALMKFLPEAGLLMPMAFAVFFMGSENHLNIKNPFCSDNKIFRAYIQRQGVPIGNRPGQRTHTAFRAPGDEWGIL